MALDFPFLAAFAATLGAMTLFAVSGRARSAEDFAVAGRQAGSWNVAGAIMGTLVGGASTIGTVQLAFLYGLSAWWFTLGAGLACLFLALFLAVPLREGEVETIPQFMARYYGNRARIGASLFSALGMFIHIVAQLLACMALLASLFQLQPLPAALLSALLVAVVALGGGMRSAGPVGLVKLLLLYATMAGAGWLAFDLAGGWTGLTRTFASEPWFNIFGYGVRAGVSDLASMLVGVVSTQIYLQAIFSARSVRQARSGALLSAVLIPPLGLFGVSVGLYMRMQRPDLESAQALPAFLLEQLPTSLAGVAFAVLLFAAVGTAAGLTLGVGTTLQADVLARFVPVPHKRLALLRLTTLGALLLALVLVLGNLGSVIMQWSFLSMGLRGATICIPLLAAIFLKPNYFLRGGALSIVIAPTVVIVAGLLDWKFLPPLFLGLAVSALVLLAGGRHRRNGIR